MNKKKIIIYSIAVILCLSIMFILSSSNNTKSNGLSKNIINGGINISETVSNKNINHSEVITKLNYPVRKIAHFTEYFILSILIYKLLFYIGKNKKILYFNTIMLCILFASIDEFHQLFVSGRSGRIQDIFIDISGSLLSILMMYLYNKKKQVI